MQNGMYYILQEIAEDLLNQNNIYYYTVINNSVNRCYALIKATPVTQ